LRRWKLKILKPWPPESEKDSRAEKAPHLERRLREREILMKGGKNGLGTD